MMTLKTFHQDLTRIKDDLQSMVDAGSSRATIESAIRGHRNWPSVRTTEIGTLVAWVRDPR